MSVRSMALFVLFVYLSTCATADTLSRRGLRDVTGTSAGRALKQSFGSFASTAATASSAFAAAVAAATARANAAFSVPTISLPVAFASFTPLTKSPLPTDLASAPSTFRFRPFRPLGFDFPTTTPEVQPVPQQNTPAPATTFNPTPVVTPIVTPTPTPSGLSSEALNRHNQYRSQHQAQPLTWATDLEQAAQAWATRCNFEHDTSLQGSGENLAWGFASATAGVDAWYNEKSQYIFGQPSPSNFHDVGHFTQMVWKGTRELGCAQASCNSQLFLVCRYRAAGNIMGQFNNNVVA